MVQIKKVSIRFVSTEGETETRYTDDLNNRRSTVYVARVPSVLFEQSNDTLRNIYQGGGGVVARIGGDVINSSVDTSLCSDSDNVRPRRFKFILNNGSTLTVPIKNRENLVTQANTITGLINGVQGVRVACIELLGEKIADLSTELGAQFTGSSKDVQNTSLFLTGARSYTIDGQTGESSTSVQLPFKVASPDGTNPPSAISTAWTSCVGSLFSARSCGRTGGRFDKRKFIPRYLVGASSGGERNIEGEASNEIPVPGNTSTAIAECGRAIVQNVGGALFCLEYHGHSDRRFNNLGGVQI